MTLKRSVAMAGGTAQCPMMGVEDDDGAGDLAAHAALTTGVHGAGAAHHLYPVPDAVPEVPAIGIVTAQDVVNALITLGLITQSPGV
jgi:hypothetical protein